MDIHSCINFILSNTQNAVNNYFKRELQEYDITPSQYALLQCLCTQDGLTPSQLAQELRLDTSSITGILSRLEKKGLIDRVYNQEDRRSVSIHLREEGRSLWSQVDRVIDEANAKITNGLDPEHYAQFLSALSMIEAPAIRRGPLSAFTHSGSAFPQKLLLDVPEFLAQVHIVSVGIFKPLDLLPQGVHLFHAVRLNLPQSRLCVNQLAATEHLHL